MTSKSMTDVAYSVLAKKDIALKLPKLWKAVCTELKYNEEESNDKIVTFYNNIMLDNRFVALDDQFDLRERRKFDEVCVDTSSIILEDTSEEEEELEQESE